MKMPSKSREDQDAETQATSDRQEEAGKTSSGGSLRLEEIRIRAYEIYIERDGQLGDELSDWLQAERELESKVRGNS